MLIEELRNRGVEIVCLAGFMRLLSAAFIREYPTAPQHPPFAAAAFPAWTRQRQALETRVRVAGCTVHLWTNYLDAGPIVLQAPVPVLDGDNRRDAFGAHPERGTPDLFRSARDRVAADTASRARVIRA